MGKLCPDRNAVVHTSLLAAASAEVGFRLRRRHAAGRRRCGVSNITMETYHQLDSCQNCHQGAQRSGADFSWILANRAYTPGGTTNSIINGLKVLPVKK